MEHRQIVVNFVYFPNGYNCYICLFKNVTFYGLELFWERVVQYIICMCGKFDGKVIPSAIWIAVLYVNCSLVLKREYIWYIVKEAWNVCLYKHFIQFNSKGWVLWIIWIYWQAAVWANIFWELWLVMTFYILGFVVFVIFLLKNEAYKTNKFTSEIIFKYL